MSAPSVVEKLSVAAVAGLLLANSTAAQAAPSALLVESHQSELIQLGDLAEKAGYRMRLAEMRGDSLLVELTSAVILVSGGGSPPSPSCPTA